MEEELKTLKDLNFYDVNGVEDNKYVKNILKAEAVNLLKLMDKYENETSCLVMPKELRQFSINGGEFPPIFPEILKKYIKWQNNLTKEDLEQ